MKISRTLHVTTRALWRKWLAEHHGKESEIWLVYNKKASGLPRVAYDDAVEEALCFGWIDGITKPIDENRYAQRFTPRREKSKWSESNRRRFARLVKEGGMTPAGWRGGRAEKLRQAILRRPKAFRGMSRTPFERIPGQIGSSTTSLPRTAVSTCAGSTRRRDRRRARDASGKRSRFSSRGRSRG